MSSILKLSLQLPRQLLRESQEGPVPHLMPHTSLFQELPVRQIKTESKFPRLITLRRILLMCVRLTYCVLWRLNKSTLTSLYGTRAVTVQTLSALSRTFVFLGWITLVSWWQSQHTFYWMYQKSLENCQCLHFLCFHSLSNFWLNLYEWFVKDSISIHYDIICNYNRLTKATHSYHLKVVSDLFHTIA